MLMSVLSHPNWQVRAFLLYFFLNVFTAELLVALWLNNVLNLRFIFDIPGTYLCLFTHVCLCMRL